MILPLLRLLGIAHKECNYANVWWGWHRARWKIIPGSDGYGWWSERCEADGCDKKRTVWFM